MKFIDEAVVRVRAGRGGDGNISFGIRYSGPTGGDGGNGGSIIVVADGGMATLLDFKFKRDYIATKGEAGRNKDQYGAGGEDLLLKVPVGTVIYDVETETVLADLDIAGAQFVVAKGGIGGKGNIHFATAWNQAPRTAEPGTPGEDRTVRFELKLLADVGLLGYPNVGKSTFISVVSRAKPKIADYPFTTLVPNLGVVRISDDRTFVIADIPGLIEGASEGAGLGHQFLRHVERCRVLLHIVEATYTTGPDRSPLKDFRVLNRELAQYAPEMANTPQVVVLNKSDAMEPEEVAAIVAEFATAGISLGVMSAAARQGLDPVLERLWSHLRPSTPAE